jgi:biofilm PGA synthesis protein PgaD
VGKLGPGGRVIAPPLIIDRSSSRPAWSRALDWILSALMWLLYLYLIRVALIDLYHLADDLFRWAFAGAHRPDVPTLAHLSRTLRDYGIVILVNGAILIVWAQYNQLRFRGPDRRDPRRQVTVADLAELYRIPAEDIAHWQAARILTMQHAPDGTLVDVISRGPGQIPPAPGG